MAPEPPSPSASSVLLPFLGPRSRRGSLASVTSRKDIDKTTLQQALDEIHTAACKSETLTSFHDFDSGVKSSKSSGKETLSGGVSGIYHRWKKSVSGGASGGGDLATSTNGTDKSPSIASRESVGRSVARGSSPSGSHQANGNYSRKLPSDAASASTGSLLSSPRLTASQSAIERSDPSLLKGNSRSTSQRTEKEALRPSEEDTATQNLRATQMDGSQDPQEGLEAARRALVEDDRSEPATRALARVLSNEKALLSEQPQPLRGDILADDSDASSDGPTPAQNRSPAAPPPPPLKQDTKTTEQDRPDGERRSRELERPLMPRFGASRLPGFAPSRASSTVGGSDNASVDTSVSIAALPALEPSPNLNVALQKGRAPHFSDKSSRGASQQPGRVSTHFRRKVMSKEFWMKDENAKECFHCGQPFSTFRRKHHCRTCGQIFDARCTTLVPGRPFGQPNPIRLCKPCEAIVYGSDDDSTVFTDDGDEFGRSPATTRPSFGSVDRSRNFDDFRSEPSSVGDVSTPSIGIPASRRNREAKRRSAVIEFDTHPTLARPSSSRSLISLSGRPRSNSHKRHQSRQQTSRAPKHSTEERGPFYQGVPDDADVSQLPAFHDNNIIDPDLAPFLSDDGSEEDDTPNIMSAFAPDANSASPGDRERLGFSGLLASAVRKGRSRLGDMSSLKTPKDDENSSITTARHMPKLARNRNASMGSLTPGRPSPRRSRSNLLLKTIETESTRDWPSTQLGYSAPSATKFLCSSAMHGSNAPPAEMNQASLDHVKRILVQLLEDANISHVASWRKALVPVLLKCADDVDPNVQRGDDMDIRHYVKLKKVPGGKPGDTSYVSGIVFSKNIALKSMHRRISNPRIAIVTFAIEYARHQAHFMSLDPILKQEKEYLHNIVGLIASLRPQVLLVQRNVSGYALRLLEEANITVAYNIKASVLAAVARVTQTTMITSVDKLNTDPSRLGTCDGFDVKAYVHEGTRRSYIFLSGCKPDLGCTIVLRGASTQTLRKIKRIAEFMCYVVYNLRLETCLMRDEFVAIPLSGHDQLEAFERTRKPSLVHPAQVLQQEARAAAHQAQSNDDTGPPGAQDRPQIMTTTNSIMGVDVAQPQDEPPSKYAAMEEECRSRVLSASPFVVFMQPFLLTQLREQEEKLVQLRKLRDQYAAADEEGNRTGFSERDRFSLVQPEMVGAPPSKDQPKSVREYLLAVYQAQHDRVAQTYENSKRLWESFIDGNRSPFDPFSHQSIVVLHSLVSSITSAPCDGPSLLGISFYAGFSAGNTTYEEDCTLGQFIEDVCDTAYDTCTDCNRKLHDHHRQYVHGYGQLSISVQRQAARMRGFEQTILMWSSCRVCNSETQVLAMSQSTWKYSFAKYLELSFWSSPLHPRAGVCQHDIHKDFLRCFGFHGLVIRVQYDPVEIYDVVVPRPIVSWKVEADLSIKNAQYTKFEVRLNTFVDSVKKRLDSIHVDTLDEKMSIEAQEKLDELRKRADDDRKDLLVKLQDKYSSSRYYELVPLNRALRYMDEKAIAWDEEFNNFERDYFPSETDIRKLAAQQLKKMFLDAHPTSDSFTSDASDSEEGTEMGLVRRPLLEKMKTENYLSEKAHDAMTSVIENHRASHDESTGLSQLSCQDDTNVVETELARRISPQEEQAQAVEREDVRHLDLAVAKSPDDSLLEEQNFSPDFTKTSSRPTTRDGSDAVEPFAVAPKPLGSGLLERIEQIRNTRAAGGTELEAPPESKIPRLADLKKRGASPKPDRPSLGERTRSTPGHLPRRSTDLGVEAASVESVGSTDGLAMERRLVDRLGSVAVPPRNGRTTPSLIPRSIPTKAESISSSVSALAKHFEQMSREFEKERLKERRQRAARSRQARANPLASSRPVVEVYRDAHEAVGEKILESGTGAEDPATKNVRSPLHRAQTTPYLPTSDELNEPLMPEGTTDQAGNDHDHVLTNAEGEGENEGTDLESSGDLTSKETEPINNTSGETSATLLSPTSVTDLEQLQPELSISDQKKNVWFKYLADFWSKRSASGWANLEYPLRATEHVFEDSDIIVREDEPSSAIALSLASSDYLNKVREFRSHPTKHTYKQHSQSKSQSSNTFVAEDEQQKAIEASLLGDTGTHMKYSFSHGQVKVQCKIFYAESFDALRRRCGVADRFVESLSRCFKYDSKGGKTKSLFLKTLDNRFIVKSLQEIELKAFTKFAPDYFAFMSYTLFHGVPSVIAKMFGLYQVVIRNPATGMDFSYYLLVMENLFYERNPNRRFDLKGSMRNRKIESTGQPDEVLLDENLVETIFEKPLFVREHARKLLQASVWNDTMWLCKQNVMDYSLMAGFADESKELIVGIIDCIRTYTWDKKLESWIKDRGKNKPTITSPKDYRNRFRVSMMQYVLQAPSCWHQFQAQMAPPKTLREQDDIEETGTEGEGGQVRKSEG